MEINPKIKSICQEFKLNYDDTILLLLALHFSLKPTVLNENKALEYFKKFQIAGIVEVTNGHVKWLIPLFKGQEVAFNWVITEYCELFAPIGKNKFHKECITRMKKLFAENIEVRKEEVIEATKMYLRNTEAKYTKFPHYFIEKGVGSSKEQSILSWIDTYRISKEQKDRDQYNSLM